MRTCLLCFLSFLLLYVAALPNQQLYHRQDNGQSSALSQEIFASSTTIASTTPVPTPSIQAPLSTTTSSTQVRLGLESSSTLASPSSVATSSTQVPFPTGTSSRHVYPVKGSTEVLNLPSTANPPTQIPLPAVISLTRALPRMGNSSILVALPAATSSTQISPLASSGLPLPPAATSLTSAPVSASTPVTVSYQSSFLVPTIATAGSMVATAPLTVFTTLPPVHYSTLPDVTADSHILRTGSNGKPTPIPILQPHCWFCPPGLNSGLALFGFVPGIYPPGILPPLDGFTLSIPLLTVGPDGDPTYPPSPDPIPQPTPQPTADLTSQSQPNSMSVSSSSCISSAIPTCTQNIILLTSISGISTTVQTETSSICTTITTCTGEAETLTQTTGSATSTSSVQLCAQTCSACLGNSSPSTTAVPNRSKLTERVLVTPEDFSGDQDKFMLAMTSTALEVDLRSDPDHPSSALVQQLLNKPFSMAVTGLFGCTSVVIMSKKGVWMSHFWESPSFQTQAAFRRDVSQILGPGDGTVEMPGIAQYIGPGLLFDPLEKPVAVIITPANRDGANDFEYPSMVLDIQTKLRELFPSLQTQILTKDYLPNSETFEQTQTAAGKVLFQYDPVESVRNNPNNPCERIQQAMFKLWVDKVPVPAFQKYWIAESNQLAGPNEVKRGDTPSFCSLSQQTIGPSLALTDASFLSAISQRTQATNTSLASSVASTTSPTLPPATQSSLSSPFVISSSTIAAATSSAIAVASSSPVVVASSSTIAVASSSTIAVALSSPVAVASSSTIAVASPSPVVVASSSTVAVASSSTAAVALSSPVVVPSSFTAAAASSSAAVIASFSTVVVASSSTAAIASSSATAIVAATCAFCDAGLSYAFSIDGISGWGGGAGYPNLHKQMDGCGALTGWDIRGDTVSFNLPFLIKSGCVERAIHSAGGPSGMQCHKDGICKI